MLLCSILGGLGVGLRSLSILCIYALQLILVLALEVTCTVMFYIGESYLTTAAQADFDVNLLRRDGHGTEANWLLDFYRGFASVYAYCDPLPPQLQPLADGSPTPYQASVVCRQSLPHYESWVSEDCLGDAAAWSTERRNSASACYVSLLSALGSTSENAGRLFCACPDAIEEAVKDNALTARVLSPLAAVFLFFALVCVWLYRSRLAKAMKQKAKRTRMMADDDEVGPEQDNYEMNALHSANSPFVDTQQTSQKEWRHV